MNFVYTIFYIRQLYKRMNFGDRLLLNKIDPELYLNIVKNNAVKFGYRNIDDIKFSNYPYKIEIINPNTGKLVRFGSSDYNDFITYKIKAKQKLITNKQALQHRENFLKRMYKQDSNLYSARNLSRNLLW